MTGRESHTKARSKRKPKKRQFRGNQHTVKQRKNEISSSESNVSHDDVSSSSDDDLSPPTTLENGSSSSSEEEIDPSSRKIAKNSDSDSESLFENQLKDNQEGYRLIDLNVLSRYMSAFSCLCSVCCRGTVKLYDTSPTEKKGLAVYLLLKCCNVRCGHEKKFHS